MKKYTHNFISLIIAVIFIFSFSSCGKQAESSIPNNGIESADINSNILDEQEESTYKGAVYDYDVIRTPGLNMNIIDAVKAGDAILMRTKSSDGEEVYTMDTESFTFVELNIPEKYSVYLLGKTNSDTYCVLCTDEEGNFVALNSNGNGTWGETVFPMLEEYEKYGITEICKTEKGYIVLTATEVLGLNNDGTLLRHIGNYYKHASCLLNGDGSVIIAAEVSEMHNADTQITKTLILDKNFNTVESYQSNSQFSGFFEDSANEGHTYLAENKNIIYRFNYADDTKEAIIDTFASSMPAVNLICIDNDLFFGVSGRGPLLWRPYDGAEPDKLILAAYNLDLDLYAYIKAYNESNSIYKIDIIDYAVFDNSENPGVGLERLRADIVSGFTPDLYDLSNLPAELYSKRGLFEDLKPYFTGDSPVLYSDLVSSAIDSLKIDECLFYIPPSFTALTICGSPEVIGKAGTWTIEDFILLSSEYEAENIFGPEMTQERFLTYVLIFMADDYIDKNELTCSFNSESFEKVLEFAYELPPTYDIKASNSQSFGRAYAGIQPIIDWNVGTGGMIFMSYLAAAFNNDIEYVGFPGLSASKIALVPSNLVAVSSSSQNKEGCIDFIYFLLSDTVQNSVMDCCPIVQESLDKKINYWESEFLERAPATKLGTFFDNTSITLEGIVNTETAKVRRNEITDTINGINCVSFFNFTLLEIILKECTPYFQGIIPVNQAAANIQSKVQIYLSEQYG